jgi:molybdopterin-containing oxidoreductase family membrane subunit
MKRPRSGVLGVFAYLDTASAAVERLRKKGFPLTVYSPTPRHELEHALEAPESAVRIFTIMGAFTGTGAGAALAIWSSLDWPLITGGKEIVSIPAFSVIMFEVTILIGALSTVAGLFLTSRLPRLGRPEGLYHPSFSSDRFGVFVHVAPDHFEEVQSIMTESGSEEVLLDED